MVKTPLLQGAKLADAILSGRDRYLMGSEANFPLYANPGGLMKNLYGGVVPSVAGVLTLPGDALIYNVSGALAITGITPPYPTFTGFIILIPSGLWTWTAAGNIGLAGSAAVGKALIFAYDGTKWWPSNVA